jgi:hypothetical protein
MGLPLERIFVENIKMLVCMCVCVNKFFYLIHLELCCLWHYSCLGNKKVKVLDVVSLLSFHLLKVWFVGLNFFK